MRQWIVQAPRERVDAVVAAARDVDAVNLARWDAQGDGQELGVVRFDVGNAAVEALLARLTDVGDVRISFLPSGVIALHPPAARAPDQVIDVRARSPVEVFLAGLQSVGSWRGFLAYSAMSGAIVWVGLSTNTSYLLVAAMLLAPFAGPAMNAAIASARGDAALLGRSAARYAAALAVAIATAFALSWALGQEIVSVLALETSQVSSVSVLLPLIAGASGATHLIQSERSSLVTGAAVGTLVAASLAPPAGIIGMALALGRVDLIRSGLFLIALQFVGIHLAATLVFRLHGLNERGVRFARGRRSIFALSVALSVALLAAGLGWQFRSSPEYQRASVSQRAAADIHAALADETAARLVRADVTFTRADIPGQETLLSVLYVQREPGAPPADALRDDLTRRVQQHLLRAGYPVTPLVAVHVLEPPSTQQ